MNRRTALKAMAGAVLAPLADLMPRRAKAEDVDWSKRIPVRQDFVVNFEKLVKEEGWVVQRSKAEWSEREGVYYVRYCLVRGLTA